MASYWLSDDMRVSVKTFGSYLEDALKGNKTDHAIRAQHDQFGNVQFYIHPVNADGETLDYKVFDNSIWPAHEAFQKPDEKIGMFLVREGQVFTADAMTWYMNMLERLRNAVESKDDAEIQRTLDAIREGEEEFA